MDGDSTDLGRWVGRWVTAAAGETRYGYASVGCVCDIHQIKDLVWPFTSTRDPITCVTKIHWQQKEQGEEKCFFFWGGEGSGYLASTSSFNVRTGGEGTE